ncbi:MAG: winged helix-turn-helix domain-containing protein [Candidatus Methanomethylophilaceae archaeon]
MSQDDATLSERLSSLETNINALTEKVCRIRMDDFKRAVIGEIVEVLTEEGERLLEKGEATMDSFAICQNRGMCRDAMEDAVRMAIDSFYRVGPDSAIQILTEFRDEILQNRGCESKECQDFAATVLNEAMAALNIARRLQERMESMGVVSISPSHGDLNEDIVDTLSLLANPHRLKILQSLYESEKCFSDLSAATGLRTGHLQFHIQALQEKGAVRRTPIRGVYAITVLGMTALEGLREFDARLGTLRKTEGVSI